MPGYVAAALIRFRHLKRRQQNSPHPHAQPTFGAKVQYANPADDSPILLDERLKHIQQVVGVFLYYGISINNTILFGLGDISVKKSVATANTTACVSTFWIILLPTPMPPSATMPVEWCSSSTVMPPTYQLPSTGFVTVGSTSSATPNPIPLPSLSTLPSSMVLSMFCAKFFKILLLHQLKPNSTPSSSMSKPSCPSEQP